MTDTASPDEMYRMAWSYLIENEDGSINMDKLKKELFDYTMQTRKYNYYVEQTIGQDYATMNPDRDLIRFERMFVETKQLYANLVDQAESGYVAIDTVADELGIQPMNR